MLQLGIRLHDAEQLPLEQLLPVLRGKGFTCCHLALGKSFPQVPCTPSSLTPGYACYLKQTFARGGVDIAILGNYLNLLHPDSGYIRQAVELYCAHLRFASLLGCTMVATETGAPNREYRFCPECRSEKTLSLFIQRLRPVVRCAEQFGVILAIEPVAVHSVWGPAACRKVLDEIGSPNLQILFDPVNLLDMTNVDHCQELFQEFFALVGPEIAAMHLKDYRHTQDGRELITVGVPAGMGEMDYRGIMSYMKREKPFLFATLEDTKPENAALCLRAMQKAYEEAK